MRVLRSSLFVAATAIVAAACTVTPAFAKTVEPSAVHASPVSATVDSAPAQLLNFTLVAPLQLEPLVSSNYSQVIGALDSLPPATLSVFSGSIECTPSTALRARARTEHVEPPSWRGASATMKSTNGGDPKVLSTTSRARET